MADNSNTAVLVAICALAIMGALAIGLVLWFRYRASHYTTAPTYTGDVTYFNASNPVVQQPLGQQQGQITTPTTPTGPKTDPAGGAAASAGTVKATATFHPNFDTSACAIPPEADGRNTAINPSLAKRLGFAPPSNGAPICGKWLQITNADSSKTIKVKILDLRAGLDHDLDIHQPAFVALDGPDRKGVNAGNFGNLLVKIVS